jgi:hypothetical protein
VRPIEAGRARGGLGQNTHPWAKSGAGFGLGFLSRPAYLWRAMKKPRDVIQPRWGVYILRKKAERLSFTVTGRDAEEARERALKEYATLNEHERRRLSVQREA